MGRKNGQLWAKAFIPCDQSYTQDDLKEQIDRMIDEYLEAHPDRKEVSRQMTYGRVQQNATYGPVAISFYYGVVIFGEK